MRDLLVFATVLYLLPVSFRRPFTGLMLFSWLAYMRPQDLCWGFARDMRFSFYVGLTMVVGWFVLERGRKPFTRWDVRTLLMLALGVLVSLSYAFAEHQNVYFTRYFIEFLKIILVAWFTVGQVDSKERLRAMLWMIAGCLAFYGAKGGVFGVLTGGATILRGPGGMMEDNNDFALALVMNIPLLWYLGHDDRDKPFVHKGTRIAIFLTVITVALTHSRGAFVAMCTMALWIAWRSGKLFRAAAGLALCGVLFVSLAPESVLERLSTIGDTQESSAAARLRSWSVAMKMVGDNPLLGVGLRNFQPRYLEYAGIPIDEEARVKTYVAHNSYLQIWAENGSLAFGCFLVMLGSVFVACRKVYWMGRSRPDMAWAANYARMMEATTIAYMTGATFLNRGHFDLLYHWLALVTSLYLVARMHHRALPQAQEGKAFRTGVAVRWKPRLEGGLVARWGRAH